MQLNYLGEDFDPAKCQNMCDNCCKKYKVTEKDASGAAVTIINLISDMEDLEIELTTNYCIGTLLGKPPTFLNQKLDPSTL